MHACRTPRCCCWWCCWCGQNSQLASPARLPASIRSVQSRITLLQLPSSPCSSLVCSLKRHATATSHPLPFLCRPHPPCVSLLCCLSSTHPHIHCNKPDGVAYTVGLKNEFKGTGVCSLACGVWCVRLQKGASTLCHSRQRHHSRAPVYRQLTLSLCPLLFAQQPPFPNRPANTTTALPIGVWSFLKASRKPAGGGSSDTAAAGPAPPKPQKPVPRKKDVAKPPSQR